MQIYGGAKGDFNISVRAVDGILSEKGEAMGRRSTVAVFLAGVLMLGWMAGPARGHTKSDVGVFSGSALVGKFGNCPQSGRGSVSGPGIGFPVTFPFGEILQKKGYWVIDTSPDPDPDPGWPDFFISVQHPEGLDLEACGRLAPVNWTAKDVPGVPKVNIGASCGMSHGHDGWGTVYLDGTPHYRLRNLGWLAAPGTSVPGTVVGQILPIAGDIWVYDAAGLNGKKTVGKVFALVHTPQTPPGNPDNCITKTSKVKSGDEGANVFNMSGVFAAYKFKGTPGADDPCEQKGNMDPACPTEPTEPPSPTPTGIPKSEAGVFSGDLAVGKSGLCPQSGKGVVQGAGMGNAIVLDGGFLAQKKGMWHLRTEPGGLVTVHRPDGLTLNLCGLLAPVNATPVDQIRPKVAIGAACGASHGHDGWGQTEAASGVHHRLHNAGWVASAGEVLPITADLWVFSADGYDGRKTIGRVAMLAAAVADSPGDPDSCASKTTTAKEGVQGANTLRVVGAYAAYKFKGTPNADEPCEKKGAEPSACGAQA